MEVVASHFLTKLGDHHVVLRETDGDGTHVVTARRAPSSGQWSLSADGVPDATHTGSVHELVHHEGPLNAHALRHFEARGHTNDDGEPLTGLSVWVPHEVRKMDGEESWRAWCASVGLNPDTTK